MSALGNVLHFFRWRLIPIRYAGKMYNLLTQGLFSPKPHRTAAVQRIGKDGFDAGPKVTQSQLAQITAIYRPRAAEVVESAHGHPFVNLFRAEDIDAENPVVHLAFSREVLDLADDYFAGRLILDSIQVLYSWPTRGTLRESQLWHKDYGDSKSFHWVAYLNDVMGPDDGPFAFIDKSDTKRIGRSAFIRRIADQKFTRELGEGQIRQFLGRAGDSVFVDPASCFHSGSRCKNARLAIFVTFNTDRPFVGPVPVISDNRGKLAVVAKQVRPDLSENYIQKLLQLA